MGMRVERYHDISTGHRVHGHESKCAHLHGHNYRIHFSCVAADGELDSLGRVIDFGEVKSRLCMWVEENWDHKFLVWENDPMTATLQLLDPEGVVSLPFNPTAENMAEFLVSVVGPMQLANTGITLIQVRIEETRKCSVSFEGVNYGA